MKQYPVAVFDPGSTDYNTIAFPETEVVIPLQEDIDCDPLQDDEVRLRNLDGSYEKVARASDPEAVLDRDSGFINYHFKRVPSGFYNISALIGGTWLDISTDLMVTPKGAYFIREKLNPEPPKIDVKPRGHEPFREPEPPPPRQNPRSLDANISFLER